MISPWIIKDVAAIGCQADIQIETPRCFRKHF
jgi:hypothetical protein